MTKAIMVAGGGDTGGFRLGDGRGTWYRRAGVDRRARDVSGWLLPAHVANAVAKPEVRAHQNRNGQHSTTVVKRNQQSGNTLDRAR